MIEKLQKFLKNKHKFDRKLEMYEIIELLDSNYNTFKETVKSNQSNDVKKALSNLIIAILKYCNTIDIEIIDILKEQYNL